MIVFFFTSKHVYISTFLLIRPNSTWGLNKTLRKLTSYHRLQSFRLRLSSGLDCTSYIKGRTSSLPWGQKKWHKDTLNESLIVKVETSAALFRTTTIISKGQPSISRNVGICALSSIRAGHWWLFKIVILLCKMLIFTFLI